MNSFCPDDILNEQKAGTAIDRPPRGRGSLLSGSSGARFPEPGTGAWQLFDRRTKK